MLLETPKGAITNDGLRTVRETIVRSASCAKQSGNPGIPMAVEFLNAMRVSLLVAPTQHKIIL